MNQVKIPRGFIYYTRYKSSRATLNTNQNLKKKKSSLAFNSSKWSRWLLSLFHSFSAFFLERLDIDNKSCQKWATLVGSLALTFYSSSFDTSSMGFKITSLNICQRTRFSSLILMYHLQNFLVCIGSLSYMSTNHWPTSPVLNDIAWCCSMLWKPVWLNLPLI